jgi:2,5-diketo-D-gluconate reductase B
MEYIIINESKIPVLGYGTWQLRGRECLAGVENAIAHGYRHIDTAQIYENESEVGSAIRHSPVVRDDIFLTTKVWMDRVRDGDLQKSVDESLTRLKTDYVDLLLIHWPVTDVPFEEQLRALQDVQRAGKTRLIGVSNFTVAQMKTAVEEIGAPLVNNQVEYHPFLTQKPVLDYIRAHGMFLTAYSPLARGKVRESGVLNEIAAAHDKTPGQVALRWLIQQERVAAIPKAASEQHLRGNIQIFDFHLTDDEMEKIAAIGTPEGRMVDPNWAPDWDAAA